MSSEMKPSKTHLVVQEKLVKGWEFPVLAAVATNKESLDLQWENLKSIAKKKGIFAIALSYSDNKDDHSQKTLSIFGDARFAEAMKILFDNQVAIF